MIHTQTQIDNLIELAIIQRVELKKLVESLPELRTHLSVEIERNLNEIEPLLREELQAYLLTSSQAEHAKLGNALKQKIAELAVQLEDTTAAKFSVLIAERAENETLLAKAEARIAEAASALPNAVKEIVTDELSRFPRAGEIDQLRKEFAEPKGLNPRGKWTPGETYQRLDLVTWNGDSFVSNIDGNRERPSRSAADWTLNAARGNSGGGGGVTSITDLLPIPSSGQILGSEGTSYVPKLLVAGSNITITETPTQITITGDEGQIELQDGTEAAPSLFFVNDTNTGLYRPTADTVGIVGGGHDILRLTDVASATDYLEVKNGIGVGSPLHVLAEGASANIGVHLQPKGSGLFTISDGTDFNKGIRFRSSSSAASAVTLIDAVSTAGRVVTLPDATDTLVGRSTTDTLSNKTMIAPALGTPTALIGTNITGTAAGLTAGNVTTNANLTGDVTSVGNATSIAPGVIVDADINASAAIAYSKLNLATSIVNADISASAAIVDTKLATISTASKVSNSATTATSANTASAIVARDASGNFTAGTITANLTGNVSGSSGSTTGNAATATALQTARAINGVNFDGTAAITVAAAAGTLTGATLASNVTASSLTSVGTLGSLTVTNPITGSVTGSSGSTTGNAATATALATGRTIAITGDIAYTSPSFDGTGNVTAAGTLATVATPGSTGGSTAIPIITINAKGLTTSITTAAVIAPAGTLSGNTLAAGVTASSLTSLGTIANLTATAGTISTTPTASTDIANKLYVDTVAQGLDAKASCVAATTADITLSGAQTIDGVSVVAGNRVLVKNQSLSQNNGIYLCASGSWTRTTDANTWDALTSAFTFIEQGTANGDCGFVCTANAGGTLGTTALPWSQFSGAGTFTAGTGLTLTGSVFSLTSPVAVANGGTGLTSLGSGVATFLGTPSSANLLAAVSDETGSGSLVFATSPTLVTPILGTPTSGNLANCTFPTLNQSTTGSAATLTTPRAIYGNNFDGSAALTQVIASTYGGTGNGFAKFSGPASSEKTFTLPNANATLLYDGGALGTPASGTVTNLTGTASININGTVGASTANTGAFTTLSATGNTTIGSSGSTPGGFGQWVSVRGGSNGAIIVGRTTASNDALEVGWTTASASLTTYTNVPININVNNATVGAFSSTGLAVTGALSATGTISHALSANSGVTGFSSQNSNAGSSAYLLGSLNNGTNTFNSYLLGLNWSGTFLTGGPTSQSAGFYTSANIPVSIGVNNAEVARFSSTGLAVTGALSATGVLSATGAIGQGRAAVSQNIEAYTPSASWATIRANNTIGGFDFALTPSANGEINLNQAGSIKFNINSSTIGTLSSAGMTVTGRVTSSTSSITSSNAGDNIVTINNSSATGYGISVSVNNNSSSGYRYFEGVDSSSTQRIAIFTNGDVKNTNGVYGSLSDIKLKKDIVDANSQWEDIKSLRVRKYRLKDDKTQTLQIGLIAQELEILSPNLVSESQDETRDENGKIIHTGEITKSVKYSVLYMKAVKALQEAILRIEQLEARLSALESKQ